VPLPPPLSLVLWYYILYFLQRMSAYLVIALVKSREGFLWHAPSFSRRKRLESNNFSLLLFWCGHSFPEDYVQIFIGLVRCALGLKRTPPPRPRQIYRSNCHTKSNIALSRNDQVFQYHTTLLCFTAAKCFSCVGLSLNLYTSLRLGMSLEVFTFFSC
jgi:hypothetical protein